MFSTLRPADSITPLSLLAESVRCLLVTNTLTPVLSAQVSLLRIGWAQLTCMPACIWLCFSVYQCISVCMYVYACSFFSCKVLCTSWAFFTLTMQRYLKSYRTCKFCHLKEQGKLACCLFLQRDRWEHWYHSAWICLKVHLWASIKLTSWHVISFLVYSLWCYRQLCTESLNLTLTATIIFYSFYAIFQ